MSDGTAPRRGEIWWVRLGPVLGSEIAKARPCLILSSTVVNERRRTVVVIPLSSSPRPAPPVLVPVSSDGRDVVAVIDQVRAVSKERLAGRIGELTREELDVVSDAVRQVLELE